MKRLGLFALSLFSIVGIGGGLRLGVGIGDITGPTVEVNLMGYASLAQTGTGLYQRMRARAFIVSSSSAPGDTWVLITADIGMGDTHIRRQIVKRLVEDPEFGGVWNDANVALVSTHSHAGVGGYLENVLPQVTSLGLVPQSANAIITGSVAAVRKAFRSLQDGNLSIGQTRVDGANVNRSPFAYEQNPQSERSRYEGVGDVEKDMQLIRFDDTSSKPRGLLSFFPVHGTSLFINNTLISGDNKGLAGWMYEDLVEPNAAPGNTSFVAGFTQANVGDTSPNTLGPLCFSPGQPWDGQACDFRTSTCGNRTQDCWGRGPGYRTPSLLPTANGQFLPQFLGYESNRIIAEKQFLAAKTIMDSNTRKPINGAVVKSVFQWVNMANRTFTFPNGTTGQTCPAALGYSFAGGTTDGPGALDFTQGNNGTSQNPFWEIVKGIITPAPSAAQVACHFPKPILLNSGYAHWPYEWSPSTIAIQLFRVGGVVVLVVPGELTTMAGRRLKEAVRAALVKQEGGEFDILLAGPANVYAHYITTREEYSVQRYEGASTLFGPNTLDSLIASYTSLVPFLAPNASGKPTSDPAPADQTGNAISLQTGVVFDAEPIGHAFGSVVTQVKSSYKKGDAAVVVFQGANPRNNLRLEQTFLTVDRLASANSWVQHRTDSHPSTVFRWERTNTILGHSTVNITWTIESNTPSGTYRITYLGDSKPLIGSIKAFRGVSAEFTVA